MIRWLFFYLKLMDKKIPDFGGKVWERNIMHFEISSYLFIFLKIQYKHIQFICHVDNCVYCVKLYYLCKYWVKRELKNRLSPIAIFDRSAYFCSVQPSAFSTLSSLLKNFSRCSSKNFFASGSNTFKRFSLMSVV